MKVTAKDLREAIESYWDKLITIEAGGKRADREFCKGQALTSFDTLVQDAENWNTINPSGDAQVLIPKAAFDAMAEKAEFADRIIEIARKHNDECQDPFVCKDGIEYGCHAAIGLLASVEVLMMVKV